MQKIFDADYLLELASKNQEQYQAANLFPHIVIDNFMDEQLLQQAVDVFPSPQELEFYRYDNPLEKKLAFDQIGKLPDAIARILLAMNSPAFLRFLEELTCIDGLIPDPYYRGGGIHQIERGGKLDVHIDFNIYKKLNLKRKLNALLYLNQNWLEEYGGCFELWSGRQENNQHILEKCEKRVLPLFNRLVVFTTSEHSYHGHPDPVTCPESWTRKSIATYYYVSEIAPEVEAHSTTFIKRPQDEDNPELNQLREMRNKGRLSSNVSSTLVADK